jgi:uncharacterized protein YcbK (DUF882 family)
MKHFELYELVDRATFEVRGEGAWDLLQPDLLYSLDGLRDFFNAPITVNNWYGGGPFQYRGYRGVNCQIGAAQSYHKKGMAADLDVEGYDAADVRRIILENQDNEFLQKIQRMEADVTWVHIDLGNPPKGRKRIYVFKA